LDSAEELCCQKANSSSHFSSLSLRIGTEDALLTVLIKLGSNSDADGHHLAVHVLAAEAIALFRANLKFDDLTHALWSKIETRLKGTLDESVHVRRIPPLFTSTFLPIRLHYSLKLQVKNGHYLTEAQRMAFRLQCFTRNTMIW
jgi:hypothetical protein